MDTIIAIKGNNFTLIASDATVSRNIVKVKTDQNKFNTIGPVTLAFNGKQGDGYRVSNFVEQKLQFQMFENGLAVRPNTVSSLVQRMVHESLRKSPKESGFIVCDHKEIFVVDQYGAVFSDRFASLGVGSSFVLGILDKEYRDGMDVEGCMGMLKRCLGVLRSRLLVNSDVFYVRVAREERNEDFSIKAE